MQTGRRKRDYPRTEAIARNSRSIPSYGAYDLIAKVSVDTIDKLKESISWHIRRIDKIKSTITLVAIEGQS